MNWDKNATDDYFSNKSWIRYIDIFKFVKITGSIIVGVFIASTVTALYIKITIMIAPILILAMSNVVCFACLSF